MKVIRLEDIEKKKHEEKRDKLTQDINKVMEGVLGGKKKDKGNWFWTLGKISLGILIFVVTTNFVLGNIWLLKFFWGEFFSFWYLSTITSMV